MGWRCKSEARNKRIGAPRDLCGTVDTGQKNHINMCVIPSCMGICHGHWSRQSAIKARCEGCRPRAEHCVGTPGPRKRRQQKLTSLVGSARHAATSEVVSALLSFALTLRTRRANAMKAHHEAFDTISWVEEEKQQIDLLSKPRKPCLESLERGGCCDSESSHSSVSL